jgi:glycosyltransferase involved in cell wall biosynthesis
MRVLHFYQYFTTPRGCWSTRVYEFAKRSVERGAQVTVVTSVYDKSDLRTERFLDRRQIDGIDVRIINVTLSNKHNVAMRLLTFFAYAMVASWYALVLPADVVVSSSGPISVAIPGLVAHYLRRRPFVFEVRDLWPEGAISLGLLRNPVLVYLARLMERICYRAAVRVVVLSEGMAEWIERRHGIRNVVVVPNASDNHMVGVARTDEILPSWARGKQIVLYAGTMGLINVCALIVDMARILEDRQANDIAVVMIGEGKERPELEAQACALGLGNIRFMGQLSKEVMMQWLEQSLCSILLVRNLEVLGTCSPNKLFDSFAAGTPMIQNTEGWIKDLIDREDCGVNVPPDDAAALAEAVVRLARNPEERRRISANARRVAREQFDRDLLAERMHKTLYLSAHQ